jgi:hypothetical protein
MKQFNNLSSWIKDISDTAELHRFDYDSDVYHVISRVIAMDHGEFETMIFTADADGEITDWGGVYEHRGYESIQDSIINYFYSTEESK